MQRNQGRVFCGLPCYGISCRKELPCIVCAKPILSGPHVFNFAEICAKFSEADALQTVTDADSLAVCLIHLMKNPADRNANGMRARGVMDTNRGALAKQINHIQKMMS